MVRVAYIDTHRQPEHLAAEVVLEAGATDLLAVRQVLGSDESHHRVHQKRVELRATA